jgi:hypothetical protein
VIVPAFLKAMKDPFPYARLASVRAASACKAFYDPQLIAHKILPAVVAMLLDPYGPVREAAFDCVQVAYCAQFITLAKPDPTLTICVPSIFCCALLPGSS